MNEQTPKRSGADLLLPPDSVRHVKKAYEQVADQLRELIARGIVAPGEKLPNETQLANQFGVSRATIREALRLLAAESLVRTSKGKGGGSFVNLPSIENISDFVGASIGLLTDAETVSLEELLETRELLEVPAARFAATRRSDADLDRLHKLAPPDFRQFGASKQFLYGKDFHAAVVDTCGNSLLKIAAQPIFSVLQPNLDRTKLGPEYYDEVEAQHREVLAAIEAEDADAAEEKMRSHLDFLRGYYPDIWPTRSSGRQAG